MTIYSFVTFFFFVVQCFSIKKSTKVMAKFTLTIRKTECVICKPKYAHSARHKHQMFFLKKVHFLGKIFQNILN